MEQQKLFMSLLNNVLNNKSFTNLHYSEITILDSGVTYKVIRICYECNRVDVYLLNNSKDIVIFDIRTLSNESIAEIINFLHTNNLI